MGKKITKVKKALHITDDFIRILLLIVGSVLSTLIIVFSVFAIKEIQADNLSATSKYILLIFLVIGLSRLINFLKERNKVSFIRFVLLLALNIGLGILVQYAKYDIYYYSLVGALFCVTIILSRIFKIIQNHSVRNIVFNIFIIVLFTLLAVNLFIPYPYIGAQEPVLIVCTIIIIAAFFEVISNATSHLKLQVLFKIVLKTYALEIILGLLTMMVSFSLVLSLYEPQMTTFADGLWYCFAVVTTIGFGDINAVTPIGRALTGVLGVYGIVVVAVITSIIVNFYNETSGKRDELKKEEKDKNKKD